MVLVYVLLYFLLLFYNALLILIKRKGGGGKLPVKLDAFLFEQIRLRFNEVTVNKLGELSLLLSLYSYVTCTMCSGFQPQHQAIMRCLDYTM